MPRFALLLAASLAALSPPLAAQFTPLTLPRGKVGFEIRTHFANWDQRFFDGSLGPAGADFSRERLDAGYLPGLEPTEAALAALTGQAGPLLNLGALTTVQLVSERELGLGVSVGISSRLTVSGLVPLRRVRVQTVWSHDAAEATAGFNPADPAFGTGSGPTLTFFAGFDNALLQITENLANGTWDSDPALRAEAEAALTEGQALREALFDLWLNPATRASLLPTAGSVAANAITGRITALQQRVSGTLGLEGFGGLPGLPAGPITSDGFVDFLTNAQGPVAGSLASPALTRLGDVELGAAYLLVDRPAAGPWGATVRAAASATLRLRTSQLANPDQFFGRGTGDRQPDLELGLTLDAARGRGALRVMAWYNRQFAGNQLRRIGPPDQPFQFANRSAALQKDPGDRFGLVVMPAYRFTPRFALVGGAEWWRRGEDRYTYVEGQPPIEGVDPNLLAAESQASALAVRLGLTWAHPGVDGRMPLDASLAWERVVAASGGRVPQVDAVRAMLRIYARFW